MMIEWFRTMQRILFMQAGPQDLPASRSSLVLSIVLYWTVLAIISLSVNESRNSVVLLLSFVLQIVLIYGVLQIFSQQARFIQTATALFAVAALIGLISLPLWLIIDPQAEANIPPALLMLILGAMFWSLAVDGSIWRHALDRSFGFGLSISALLFVIHFVFMQSLSPPAAAS